MLNSRKLTLFFCFLIKVSVAQNTSLPIMEMIFGPTATNAVVGNGGLTIGISKYGEMVNLRWPCSNYYDQLNFETVHPVPAYNKVEWYDKYLGAKKYAGSYAGIRFIENNKIKISWLRDNDWQVSQYYLNPSSPIVCTKFVNKTLGMSVICTDFVLPNPDVYCRDFKFDVLPNNTLKELSMVYMNNMAMCNTIKPNNPNSDWADDSKNGYVTYFDSTNNATISFILNENSKTYKSLPSKSNLLGFINETQKKYNTTEYKISKATPNIDVFCALGSNQNFIENTISKSSQFSIDSKNKTNNAVLGASISLSYLPISTTQSTTIYFSLADNYSTCVNELNAIKKHSFDDLIKITNNYWTGKMANAKMPNVPEEQMKITLKRILINTLLATNKGNGIGSSVGETQPPYTMIWIRDSAIMGYMLDCAGFTKEAEDNVQFIANNQRTENGQDCKNPKNKKCYKGTWSQCYFANGLPGWDYDFEVDEVGWGIWAMYTHSLFLEKQKQKSYLLKLENNIIMAADFLVEFKDKNGLQKTAREDDLLWESQTILGASTTLIGLKSAIASLEILNPNHERLTIYRKRKQELEDAINKEFWNQKNEEFGTAGYGNFGPRGLIIWPALFLPTTDNKIQKQAQSINNQIMPFFKKELSAMNKEWWYLGKSTTALAYASGNNNDLKIVSKEYLKILLTEVCNQDTYIYGETPMLRKNKTGNLYYDNRVGQPSNHPASWIYITAELLYGINHKELYK
jgi:hypothetical protein